MTKLNLIYIIIVTTILLTIASPAYAYLDPGTGSALLQGILGALAAIAVAVKLYWYRILRFLGLKKKTPMPQTSDQNREPAANTNKTEAEQSNQS